MVLPLAIKKHPQEGLNFLALLQ